MLSVYSVITPWAFDEPMSSVLNESFYAAATSTVYTIIHAGFLRRNAAYVHRLPHDRLIGMQSLRIFMPGCPVISVRIECPVLAHSTGVGIEMAVSLTIFIRTFRYFG